MKSYQVIYLPKEVKDQVIESKIHPRESQADVIKRLLAFYKQSEKRTKK